MVEKITVYRGKEFRTEPKPEWWDVEQARVFDKPVCPSIFYGEDVGQSISRFELEGNRGHLVDLSDGHQVCSVWVPTDADWLDFLTTRARGFLGLSSAVPTLDETLNRMTNALIAFARHGQGTHIDRLDGESRIDRQRDTELRKQRA